MKSANGENSNTHNKHDNLITRNGGEGSERRGSEKGNAIGEECCSQTVQHKDKPLHEASNRYLRLVVVGTVAKTYEIPKTMELIGSYGEDNNDDCRQKSTKNSIKE